MIFRLHILAKNWFVMIVVLCISSHVFAGVNSLSMRDASWCAFFSCFGASRSQSIYPDTMSFEMPLDPSSHEHVDDGVRNAYTSSLRAVKRQNSGIAHALHIQASATFIQSQHAYIKKILKQSIINASFIVDRQNKANISRAVDYAQKLANASYLVFLEVRTATKEAETSYKQLRTLYWSAQAPVVAAQNERLFLRASIEAPEASTLSSEVICNITHVIIMAAAASVLASRYQDSINSMIVVKKVNSKVAIDFRKKLIFGLVCSEEEEDLLYAKCTEVRAASLVETALQAMEYGIMHEAQRLACVALRLYISQKEEEKSLCVQSECVEDCSAELWLARAEAINE